MHRRVDIHVARCIALRPMGNAACHDGRQAAVPVIVNAKKRIERSPVWLVFIEPVLSARRVLSQPVLGQI